MSRSALLPKSSQIFPALFTEAGVVRLAREAEHIHTYRTITTF